MLSELPLGGSTAMEADGSRERCVCWQSRQQPGAVAASAQPLAGISELRPAPAAQVAPAAGGEHLTLPSLARVGLPTAALRLPAP